MVRLLDRIQTEYYNIKWFFVNLWVFRQHLWIWRNWDFIYAINVFCGLLEELGQQVLKKGIATNSVKEGRKCMFAARQLREAYNRSAADDRAYQNLARDSTWNWYPVEGSDLLQLDLRYKTNNPKVHAKLMRHVMARARKEERQRQKEAWSFIAKNILNWWD